MFNRERTKEEFGYDLDLSIRRRTAEEVQQTGINKKDLMVIDNCPGCGIERKIKLRQSRKNNLCPKCFHNQPAILEAKRNQKKDVSLETREKMKKNHWSRHGGTNAFKGKHHSDEAKKLLSDRQKEYMSSLTQEEMMRRTIASSCTVRGIPVEDFTGFISEELIRLRGSKEGKDWERQVLERDNYKCQFPGCLEHRKDFVTVHHKDGFHWCAERRFDVSNGVTLCRYHHSLGPNSYHSQYGVAKATESKYEEWINQYSFSFGKRKVYIVTGAPGSGKSWVCNQLVHLAYYLPYDDFPKETHIALIQQYNNDKPIIYDPWRKATTFCKRYKDAIDIVLIVIAESKEVVKERIIKRGGTYTPKIDKYVQRALNISKKASFSGTSQECLDFLIKDIKSAH